MCIAMQSIAYVGMIELATKFKKVNGESYWKLFSSFSDCFQFKTILEDTESRYSRIANGNG